ncbi:hypothetical protein JOC85_002077 [Bacillus mesophilus]|uniref:Uncharacterized protein n=1 Tax=Bacillus mesophilus TaxID=1808955 RepID=A0A6M0Q4M1_9BACI|nr:hypothetical protein [Bacillus mesophilus]MBM7661305.1 hypothetical protein [Bacillus mesophilus]NEY71174.1 hypothetical protein [Bacillus mesophilus]
MTDNKDMPDFDSLSDRVIAEPTEKPIFAMKTKLDPETPEEDNPYYKENISQEERKKLDEYFGKS